VVLHVEIPCAAAGFDAMVTPDNAVRRGVKGTGEEELP
jgi:hypothetical protein